MKKYLKIILPILFAAAAILIIGYYKSPALFRPHTTVTKFTDTSSGSLEDYYQLGQSLSVRGSVATTSATFLAAGDIMLSRNVAAAIQKAGDVDLPFEKISNVLKSTDFNFGNLESPFGEQPHCWAVPNDTSPCPPAGIIGGHSLVFSAPPGYGAGLKDYNFQILNLANNHAYDQQLPGIDNTRQLLDQLGIAHEGTGDNLDEAWTPAVVTSNGIKICFIGASFSSLNDGGKTKNDYVARIEDADRLKSVILNLRSTCDFIVATMHVGTEYTRNPNKAQVGFAHAAIDDGADIVIGAHPHWVQTIEKYKGKYIFYSLGNFIFDQNFSPDTMEGLTLKITLSKTGCLPSPLLRGDAPSASEGQRGCADDLQGSRTPATLDSIQLLPVIIRSSQPRPATADESKNILRKIGENDNVLMP